MFTAGKSLQLEGVVSNCKCKEKQFCTTNQIIFRQNQTRRMEVGFLRVFFIYVHMLKFKLLGYTLIM